MLFIKDCSCCPAFILNGAWKALSCKAKQWPNQSSYTSNHLIAKRDEYPCHAKQWPTPTSLDIKGNFHNSNKSPMLTDSMNLQVYNKDILMQICYHTPLKLNLNI